MSKLTKPVLVIGAGPVGIAAAAHLLSQGLDPVIMEKGKTAGSSILEWGHVGVFTAWKNVVDKAVINLLKKSDWVMPDEESLPTGQDIVEKYLIPAATKTVLKDKIKYGTTVTAISKKSHSKSSSSNRDEVDYTVHYTDNNGDEFVLHTEAVIDASGTWQNPNPIGMDGLPIPGEKKNKDLIKYGLPNVNDVERDKYEGNRILVLGGGHSAINVVLDLIALKESNPNTKIYWGMRSNRLDKLTGKGINNRLPARAKLGLAAKKAIETGELEVLVPLQVSKLSRNDNSLILDVEIDGHASILEVDRIVVSNGFRPDLNMLREVRLDIDEVVEAPTVLAPLIDPNVHSCGSVKPHGVQELSHFDKNFFIAGIKAYGRAPTFLMLTGYEQVRSIAAELAGDHDAALRVELELPSQKKPEEDKTVNKLEDACCACCPELEEKEKAAMACCN